MAKRLTVHRRQVHLHTHEATVEPAPRSVILGSTVAVEELPQGSAPVDGRTQQLTYFSRHVTLASATLLGLGLTTPQCMVDLLVQRVTVCLVHLLGIVPAMLVEARLALAATLLLVCALLLLQYVEDLLGAHAIEPLIIQAHAGAIWVARELAHALGRVSLHDDAVNHVVTSDVGELVVCLVQLAPCSQVPKPLVNSLVQTHEGQLCYRQRLDEGSAIHLVTAIGVRRSSLVAQARLAYRHKPSPQAQAR